MKIHFSLPKDEGFFNSYATLTPTLYRLGFLAQLVSALTEIGIIYSLVHSTLADAFPRYAQAAALIGAVVGTAFLEVGLRKFLPYSFRAILYRRFGGLHRVMSLFILLIAVGLLFSSGLLSFKGSKDLVEAVANPPEQQSTAGVDSLYQQQHFGIKERFTTQAAAIHQQYKTQVSAQQLQLRKYAEREVNTGLNYSARKQRIREKIAELRTQEAEQLAELETAKAQALDQAEQRLLQGREKVELQNDEAKTLSANRIWRYGSGLAWFTVVCLAVLVLSIALDEIHKKGSGIQTQALPNQYHFSQSITRELADMLSEKWNYFTRTWIRKHADRTPPPLQPTPLPVLYDVTSPISRRVKVNFQPVPEQSNLFEASSGDKAHSEPTATEVSGNGSSTANRTVVRGFYPATEANATAPISPANAMRYVTEENVVIKKVDKDAKPCQQCEEYFRPKTTWQKYCSRECRENFHAEKHGKRFNPGQYHKARRKKVKSE